MIEIKHLQTLSCLAQTNSLAATATARHMTQSALSHQIKELEQRIGQPLFYRKTRPVHFTPQGELLLALAQKVLPELEQAESQLLNLVKGEHGGRLNLSMDCHACLQWIMPALKSYQKSWPDVDLDFISGFDFEPLPALLNGQLDLVITSDIEPRNEVYYTPLFDFEMRLITANDHPLANKQSIDAKDLADQTLLTYPVPKARLDIVNYFLAPANVQPKKWRQVDNTLLLVQMTGAGFGVATIPSWAVYEFNRQDLLANLSLGDGLWRRLYAAVRVEDKDKPYIQDFFKQAKHYCETSLQGIKAISPRG